MLRHSLLLILILAGFLRLFMLGSVPASLNWDEISMGYSAYSISQTGADEWGQNLPVFFRSYGEWKSAVYIYLLVPIINVLGLNAWAIRLPSAIFGVISVYLLYLIGHKLYNRSVGLWASFLMAVAPWSLFLSRPAFEANVSLTLILLGLYSAISIIPAKPRQSWIFVLLSALSFGLAPHTYNSAKIVVPLLVLYLVYYTGLYRQLKKLALMLFVLAVFATPILLNLSSGSTQARYNQVSIISDGEALASFYAWRASSPLPETLTKLLINKVTFSTYQFIDNYLSYFSPSFLAWSGGTHTQHNLPYHGLLYLTQFLALIIGIWQLTKTKLNPLPVVIILLGLIPASLTRDPSHVLRSILAVPGFILLSALGWQYLLAHKYFKWILGFLVLEVLAYLALYFFWYSPTYARDWQYGYPEVSAYLQEHAGDYDHIVVTKWYGQPQLFLAFYGAWDPATYQLENQPNMRYQQEGKLWLDQLEEYQLGKYTFKYLDWQNESRGKNTLYVGKGDDFYEDSNILKTITYPDGSVAFHLVKGDK